MAMDVALHRLRKQKTMQFKTTKREKRCKDTTSRNTTTSGHECKHKRKTKQKKTKKQTITHLGCNKLQYQIIYRLLLVYNMIRKHESFPVQQNQQQTKK